MIRAIIVAALLLGCATGPLLVDDTAFVGGSGAGSGLAHEELRGVYIRAVLADLLGERVPALGVTVT